MLNTKMVFSINSYVKYESQKYLTIDVNNVYYICTYVDYVLKYITIKKCIPFCVKFSFYLSIWEFYDISHCVKN